MDNSRICCPTSYSIEAKSYLDYLRSPVFLKELVSYAHDGFLLHGIALAISGDVAVILKVCSGQMVIPIRFCCWAKILYAPLADVGA